MPQLNKLSEKTNSKILIIDDNKKMVNAIQRLLLFKKKGDIKISYDGQHIKKLVSGFKPNLIILDIKLSEFNGFDICSTIRQDPENKDIKILALSGTVDEKEIRKMIDFGADDYLEKPFQNNVLMEKIEKLLDIRNQTSIQTPEVKRIKEELNKVRKDFKIVHKKLLQSDKLALIGQLAAGIAHEIKNPVGFVGSNLQTLGSYIDNFTKFLYIVEKLKRSIIAGEMDKAKEISKEMILLEEELTLDFVMSDMGNLLRESQEGIERIKKIITDLRTFVRPDSDLIDLVNIEEIIENILIVAWNEIKYKAELRKEYGKIPLVKGNPQKLGQVFINLLINAAQAIETRGVIEIKTYLKDNFVCVTIKDNGHGISKELLEHIFDPFFTTKPTDEGTGLGLSISYDIIKEHGGDIKIESKPEKGTTFIVMLPRE